MSPNEIMQELSCNFFHKKLINIGLGFLPGGSAIKTGIDLFGGGGGGTAGRKSERAAAMSKSQAPIHIAHGHHIGSSGHIWPAGGWTEAATLARGTSDRGSVLRSAGFSASKASSFVARHGGAGQNFMDPCPGPLCPDNPQLPETPHITTPAESEFQAVAGAFNMPAIAPKHELIGKFICPPGMVLGEDNLCYPKQVLRRDSRFRKHRPGVRPILTGGDRNAIRRAKRVIPAAREAISGLGVTVAKRK